MGKYMSLDNAEDFAEILKEYIDSKDLTPGTGICIHNGIISTGVLRFVTQPFTYDVRYANETLIIYKDNYIFDQIVLDSSGSTSIMITSLGTFTYSVQRASIEKTYTSYTSYPTFNIAYVEPQKADMYPFATATDAQLAAMLESYYDGSYDASDVALLKSTYLPLGAKRSIHLDHMDATYNLNESHFDLNGADYEYVIVGHEHDDLVTPIGSKSKALLTLHQDRILFSNTTATSYYAPGSANAPSFSEGGGNMHSDMSWKKWDTCERRLWCNDTFYNAIQSSIKSLVKEVSKRNYFSNEYYTNDKVFLLSLSESLGTEYFNDEGEQYEYYASDYNLLSKFPKCNLNGTLTFTAWYWLRSISSQSFYYFKANNSSEIILAVNDCTYNLGIAPAFCL